MGKHLWKTLCAALTASAAFGLVAAIPLAQNAETLHPLELGQSVERDISGKEKHLYQVRLVKGQCAFFAVRQTSADVVVEELARDGRVVQRVDDEIVKNSEERIAVVADQDAMFRMAVSPTLDRAPAGRYQIALTAIRGATPADSSLQEIRKLRTEARLLVKLNREKEALVPAERALALAEPALAPNDPLVGLIARDLANVHHMRSDYPAARSLFERSLAVLKAARGPDDLQTALAEKGLGMTLAAMSEFTRADPLLTHALHVFERTLGPDHPLVAEALRSVGVMYSDRGDLVGATRAYERALAITERWFGTKDRSYGLLQNNLGVAYLRQRNYDSAREHLERALVAQEHALGPHHLRVATVLQNLGIIARERKDYAAAEQYYGRALAIREKELGSDHPHLGAILINIANLHGAQRNYAKSLEIHLRALAIFEKNATHWEPPVLSLGNIARTYAALGDFENALRYQQRVDAAIELDTVMNLAVGSERQKLAYLNGVSDRIHRTISLNLQLQPENRTAARLAVLALLQRKARALDAVADTFGALQMRASAADRALLDRLSETTARLARLALNGAQETPVEIHRKALGALEETKEELEAEMSRRSEEFRVHAQPVTVEAIQAAIPSNAVLLEFVVYRPFDPKSPTTDTAYAEPRFAVYVLRHDGDPAARDLGPANAVVEAIAEFREALQDRRRSDVKRAARVVDDQIMKPIRDLLGDATRLLISPDGELALIPFEALVDERGRYLVERYAISYLTAGRDLLRMQAKRESRSDSMIFADAFFGEAPAVTAARPMNYTMATARERRRSITVGEDLTTVYFAPLAGTLQEARSIQSIFPDGRLLTGRQATESALKEANAPRILHIATHGFFLHHTVRSGQTPGAPQAAGGGAAQGAGGIANPLLRSGLALAGANLNKDGSDDGILTALEAAHLNLWGTKLVTLSACDTGVGVAKSGEGVYGLRRSMFLAGAETLLMSLWPVSDYGTREMMTSYYRGLKTGLGRGEALRQAQLSLMKRKGREHPFYWASFIQAGEWANLDGRR